VEADMSSTAPVRPGKSGAVTAVGLLTLLLGAGHAALGGWLVAAGASWAAQANNNPWGPFITLFGMLPALIVLLGIAFLVQGVIGAMAGLGYLGGRSWGRPLALVFAALAALWGLLALGATDRGAAEVTFGAANLLYAALAFLVLLTSGVEGRTGEGARAAGPSLTP
jgi:hypothetical protein